MKILGLFQNIVKLPGTDGNLFIKNKAKTCVTAPLNHGIYFLAFGAVLHKEVATQRL
jgi:hypothetical protein